jgi:hypothetical protein
MNRVEQGNLHWVFGIVSLQLLVFAGLALTAERTKPPEFLQYPCQAALEGIPFHSAQPRVRNGKDATFSLLQGPKGMTIDSQTGVVHWKSPVRDNAGARERYRVRLAVSTVAGRDEMEWVLQVVWRYLPDVQILPTKYADLIVPSEIAQWITKYHAVPFIDRMWEYQSSLMGQEPHDWRLVYLFNIRLEFAERLERGDPTMLKYGDADLATVYWQRNPRERDLDPVRGWNLGSYFHEIGHGFLDTTHIADGVAHQNWAQPYIHQLTSFLQAAFRCRVLENPARFGLAGESLTNYRLHVSDIRTKYEERLVPYRKWLASGGDAESWVKRKQVETYGVMAYMAILIADKWGAETLEKTLKTFRHDALPGVVYSWADSPLKKNTLLVCVSSCAVGQDLRGFYKQWGFAVDSQFYDKLLPIVQQTVAELPNEYCNGWIRCPHTGHYYRMMRWNADWQEACRMARREGGHLVTINSQEEDQWVSKRFGNHGPFWIGLSRKDGADGWSWITGETTAYQNWQANRPKAQEAGPVACSFWASQPGWRDCASDREMVVIVERDTIPETTSADKPSDRPR